MSSEVQSAAEVKLLAHLSVRGDTKHMMAAVENISRVRYANLEPCERMARLGELAVGMIRLFGAWCAAGTHTQSLPAVQAGILFLICELTEFEGVAAVLSGVAQDEAEAVAIMAASSSAVAASSSSAVAASSSSAAPPTGPDPEKCRVRRPNEIPTAITPKYIETLRLAREAAISAGDSESVAEIDSLFAKIESELERDVFGRQPVSDDND